MSDARDDGAGREGGSPEDGGREGKKKTSRWEWVVGAVGALLVLGVIGFMLYQGLTTPATPPRITLQVDTIIEAERGYVVEFRAHNEGNSAAAGLTVEGELRSDTGTVERSEVTINYVPGRSKRSGGLFFTENPRDYALEIRPKGYDVP